MKKATVIFIALLSIACSGREEKSILTIDVDAKNITSDIKETLFPKDSIQNPIYILSLDHFLVLGERDTRFAVSIYDTETGAFQRIGRMGRGDMEIQNVGRIGRYPSRDAAAFYIFDNFVEKIYVYTLNADSCKLWRIEDMKDFQEFEIDNDIIIGKTGTKNRYLLRNSQTGVEIFFGDTKYAAEIEHKTGASLTYDVINTEHKLFACFSAFGEACEIMDYSDVERIKYIYHKIYTGVIWTEDGQRPTGDTKKGFGDVTGNNEYIFALCGDKTLKEYIQANADVDLANNICIFNWNGKYIKKLICDKSIMSININKEKRELFAIILDDDALYKIVSLSLDDIL